MTQFSCSTRRAVRWFLHRLSVDLTSCFSICFSSQPPPPLFNLCSSFLSTVFYLFSLFSAARYIGVLTTWETESIDSMNPLHSGRSSSRLLCSLLPPVALFYFLTLVCIFPRSPLLLLLPPPVRPLTLRLRVDVVLNIKQFICSYLQPLGGKITEAKVTNDTDLLFTFHMWPFLLSKYTRILYVSLEMKIYCVAKECAAVAADTPLGIKPPGFRTRLHGFTAGTQMPLAPKDAILTW